MPPLNRSGAGGDGGFCAVMPSGVEFNFDFLVILSASLFELLELVNDVLGDLSGGGDDVDCLCCCCLLWSAVGPVSVAAADVSEDTAIFFSWKESSDSLLCIVTSLSGICGTCGGGRVFCGGGGEGDRCCW